MSFNFILNPGLLAVNHELKPDHPSGLPDHPEADDVIATQGVSSSPVRDGG